MRPLRLFVLVLCAWLTNPNLQSQESGADQLAKLIFIHSVEIEEAEKPYRAKLAELNGNYIKALEREAEKAQSAGQLEQLLAVRNEIDHVRTNGALGNAPFPGDAMLRQKYNEAAAQFAKENQSALVSTLQKHIGELKELKVTLTKAGDLESAIEASKHILALNNSLTNPNAAPVSGGTSSPKFSDKVITTSPLHGVERFYGNEKLEPGIYEFPGPVAIGGGKVDDPKAYIELQPGTTIRGGRFLADDGALTAEGVLFSDVDLQVDLGATLTATDCLFDRGRQRKGGAWTTKYYSAKWIFDNCVFYQSFLELTRARDNGLKVQNCTIIGADIVSPEYYESPVEESSSEWRQVERCHFINCNIPEKFLLMTEDCIFENCTFDNDIDTIEPEKSARVTLHFRNSPVQPPPGSDRITFNGKNDLELKKSAGAQLEHDFPIAK